jgi:hypothetical protein
LNGALESGSRLSSALNLPISPMNATVLSSALRLGSHVAGVPVRGRATLSNPAWATEASGLAALVAAGERASAARLSLDSVVAEVAWDADVSEARMALAAHAVLGGASSTAPIEGPRVYFVVCSRGSPPMRWTNELGFLTASSTPRKRKRSSRPDHPPCN